MENLFTLDFDNQFRTRISHLDHYPEMLPFVGKKWVNSNKILFIGESHYLPYDEIKTYNNEFDFFENWYNGKSTELNNNHRNYINTRNNIITVESNRKREKPLNIYYNIKAALKEIKEFENENLIFDKFAYYNYYQKPAYVKEKKNEDRSIKPNEEDNQIAFSTFKEIVNILDVKTVIFISTKSYDSFSSQKQQLQNSNIKIDFVPHAGKQWWNRASKRYALAGANTKRTGKEKFIAIIKESIA